MGSREITLSFEPGIADAYGSCREFVQARIHQLAVERRLPQKAIAADMDYSPSTLSRKLAQSPDDSQRFTLDDLERYIEITGDAKPVLYMVEKYLTKTDKAKRREELLAELAALEENS